MKRLIPVRDATPGRLGPDRPVGEIWECVLWCGHKTWRPRVKEKGPPRTLKCDKPYCKWWEGR